MRTARFSKASDDAHLLIGKALGVTYRRDDASEEYVCIPPAFMITDTDGAVWTLGMEYNSDHEFMVLRNDQKMGIYASRIERRGRRIQVYGKAYGKAIFSRSRRHWI